MRATKLRQHPDHPPWSPVRDDLLMTSQQVENHRFPAPSLLEQRFLKQVVIVAQPAGPGFKTGVGGFKIGVSSFGVPDPRLGSFESGAQTSSLSGRELV
jgi:hypothetical protein